MARGQMLLNIHGRRLPLGFFDLSDKNPAMGAVTASHKIAIKEIVPAIAGLTLATWVKKNRK